MANRAFVILGRFVGFLINPFRDPTMSLAEQLKSLAAAAHTLFLLYRFNRTSFCPGQWFYDVQTFIKAIFWNVAKTKLLDPNGKFYILQCGTDRQEGDFGIIRLLESNHNCDLLGLQQRASQTAGIAHVFSEHPSWDRGHRRLSLEGKEGVDHTNPKSWKGNVHVQSVSLFTAWVAGRRATQDLFSGLNVDIDDFSSLPDDVDLLRPFGDYVGLREDSVCDNTTEDSDPSLPQLPRDAMLELEDLLPEPNEVGEVADLDVTRQKPEHWLDFGGKMVHKSSAVRFLLYNAEGRKSYNRDERAAGVKNIRTYSREPVGPSLADNESLIGDFFLIRQLVATFIRVEKTVALAIVQVTGIQNKTESVDSIEISALSSHDVTFRGQVLVLSKLNQMIWAWNGKYEVFPTSKDSKPTPEAKKPQHASKKSALVEVRANMVQPIKGSLQPSQSPGLAPSYTWHFDSSEVEALVDVLWDQVKKNVDAIPCRSSTKTFPCRGNDGEFAIMDLQIKFNISFIIGTFVFVSESGSAAMVDAPKAGSIVCFLCGKEMVKARMRDHVARHLVAKMLGISESLMQPVGLRAHYTNHEQN
jgi:hypothetical protein